MAKSRPRQTEPLKPSYAADLFAGTARYYAAYRVPYPEALLWICERRHTSRVRGGFSTWRVAPGEWRFLSHPTFQKSWLSIRSLK